MTALPVVVRCASHRARHKLLILVGDCATPLFSFSRGCTGGFYRIPREHLTAARAITGVTRAKDGDDLMRCWR